MPRIYLDNAATSWPKPDAVYRAVDDYQRRLGAPAGRGSYREADEVERTIAQTRRGLAALLNAPSPDHLIFTLNGTDALNLAIHGLLRPGDHVITSVAEHNSVLRPLRACEAVGVTVTHVGVDRAGIVDPEDIRRALTPHTRLIALTAASNVTGAIQPIRAVGHIAQSAGIRFLVDAAQALGHVPLDVQAVGCDLLAAPGHKGLLGPMGTGVLYVRPGMESELRPVRQGGTGSRSDDERQPDQLPDKYEAGNLNVPGLFGLHAGIVYLKERGLAEIRQHEIALTDQLLAGLSELPGVRIHGPRNADQRVGVVSASFAAYDPQVAAAVLDSAHEIQVRAGLHCAPRMHRALGTLADGGTVRFSVGPFTTEMQITLAIQAATELASS